MSLIELEDKLIELLRTDKPNQFIYDFTEIMGIPKATISRAKKSNQEHDNLFIKNKVFYRLTEKNVWEEFKKAELLLKDYKNIPRFTIITNYKSFLAKDNKTMDTLFLDDIQQLPFNYDFFLPWQGIEKIDHDKENPADVKAAERFAKLYQQLQKDNPNLSEKQEENFNIFLIRILFMLFAEDTNIIPPSLFTDSIQRMTAEDGSDMNQVITDIFSLLDNKNRENVPTWLEKFPYVNGQLFTNPHEKINFSAKSRRMIIEAGNRLNWKEINPDIFGSMVQSVASEDNRSHLGMHYTSVPNIMKVIRPLFLDELTNKYHDIIQLTDRHEQQKRLKQLQVRIAQIKLFDPACGSGNFLIIAYKELRKLEINIIKQQIHLIESSDLKEKNKSRQIREILDSINEINLLHKDKLNTVHMGQLYGIEIDSFAHEVARLSLWIAEHQMNVELSKVIPYAVRPTLPLQTVGDIKLGNALKIDWQELLPHELNDEVYIFGNPPYLGGKKQGKSQKEDMKNIFSSLVKGWKNMDYISGWFFLGSQYISNSNAKMAFVSTNSISQGEQVEMLWPLLLKNNVISFVYPSFKWKNSARGVAGVTVTIVGMESGNMKNIQPRIYKDGLVEKVDHINAYLTAGNDVIVQKKNKPLSKLPEMDLGSMPKDGGAFSVSEEMYLKMVDQYPKVKNILRPYTGSAEYIKGTKRFVIWLPNQEVYDEYKGIPFIKERIDAVRDFRKNSKAESTREAAKYPWAFKQRGNQIKADEKGFKRNIIVPRVSSEKRDYVPFGYVSGETVVSDSAMVIFDAPLWVLALLESNIHMVWLKAIGGKLETRYRYSKVLVYNTFPVPAISTQRKNMMSEVMEEILDLRDQYGTSLAELYNSETMPADLKKLHKKLDGIVERAYRQRPFEDDSDRLSLLLDLYEDMSK
ncbi:class I SAM-dependent DNA methyltransferase [Fructobacillus durionis]|uniref:site-specific DNA-methyltransferase (adenine-specific) n=1 Tax=Fructobacillus durionis TaxID=283737 RepID=A0A1I1GAF0_9LACO|nr:DNA methyltransferase [Fructobacillus durionis]SFC06120.1 Type II restriction/modification system, DNA methylase subunit YeeA [Fructobacillus durionis]